MDKLFHIALLDDDIDMVVLLEAYLSSNNFKVTTFSCPMKFEKSLDDNNYDLIISDLMLPGKSGMEIVDYVKTSGIEAPIILISAHGQVKNAVTALKKGAYDFIQKPFNLDHLKNSILNATQYSSLEKENLSLKKRLNTIEQFDKNFIGKSKSMQQVFSLILKSAPTMANVLITGESGTGKEVVAKSLHKNSQNPEAPYIAINCSAIPENLLESELFGHVKGAFTGADSNRRGLIQEARGGTLFLDEIGDMPLNLQVKLLRVLQERKVKPLGSNKYEDVNVRIISATHQSLDDLISTGKFREDLYYRLCVIPISVPPLRERKEDIPYLTSHFLKKYKKIHQCSVASISKSALDILEGMYWKGNVRELENTIERALILSSSDELSVEDISSFKPDRPKSNQFSESIFSKLPTLKELEHEYMKFVLDHTENDKVKAGEILGKNWRTIYRKLEQNREIAK